MSLCAWSEAKGMGIIMRTKTLFVLGDSISLHYGPYLKQMLRGIYHLAKKEGRAEAMQNLDIPVGGNGGDSRRVLEYLLLQEAKDGLNTDLILLNCGLHDIKRQPLTGTIQVPLEEYEHNLQQILTLLNRSGASPLWIRTTPVDDGRHNSLVQEFHRYNRDVEHYNEAADRLMRAAGIPLIDLYTFSRNLGSSAYCDHVHYSEAARAQQAAFIAGFIAYAWEK